MYGQYNIDEKIYKIFNERNTGIFLEAGAADPFAQNNTVYLEQKGWKGLLIDPRVSACEKCRQYRPNSAVENFALVEKNHGKDTLLIGEDTIHGGLCTGSSPKHLQQYTNVEVPCCTLDVLLKKYCLTHVNFFSLDTEGYEHQIIDGIDFEYTKFDLMLIETHEYVWSNFKYNTNNFDYIQDYGYCKCKNLITEDENNEYYVIMAHKDFLPEAKGLIQC